MARQSRSRSKLRILFLTENLASGGAQRQLVLLASNFAHLDHDVTVLTYHSDSFFAQELAANSVRHLFLNEPRRVQRTLACRRFLRSSKPDAVVSFLSTPNLIAELSSIPIRSWGLVVSERNSYTHTPPIKMLHRYLFHLTADYVTTNSHTNRLLIERHAPWLRGRIVTIYNTVDLDHFSIGKGARPVKGVRLVGVGRHAYQKNISSLVKAIGILTSSGICSDLTLDWYGDSFRNSDSSMDTEKNNARSSAYDQATGLLRELKIEDRVHFHQPVKEIRKQYWRSSALILPSFFEGLPNVVCEAMACGLPILMSRVCDATALVKDGENGLLFDPHSVNDIASALHKFANLSQKARTAMGKRSRALAEELFRSDDFTKRYSEIVEAAASKRRIRLHHWTEKVPESAIESARVPILGR